MQRNKLMGVVALLLCIGMMIPSVSAQAATTIYNEKTGVEDGLRTVEELWRYKHDLKRWWKLQLLVGQHWECVVPQRKNL